MLPRLKDVAEAAGVSCALVSMYLNHHDTGHMKDDTRQRIREAIERLGYRPNPIARSLRTSKTRMIGYIGGDMRNETRQRQMVLFHDELEKRNYQTLMAYGQGDTDATQASFKALLQNSCCGVIVNQTFADFLSPENVDVPVVFCSRHPPKPGTENTIFCDFSVGMNEELDYLESLGHREIFLVWSARDWDPLDGRLVTFQKRYPNNVLRIAQSDGDIPEEPFRKHRRENPQITAYACISDITAVSLLSLLNAMNLRVPEDVSVCGWDNDRFGKPLGLTTVETPLQEMANSAITLLLNRLEGKHNQVKTRIESHLLPRKTVAKPPI